MGVFITIINSLKRTVDNDIGNNNEVKQICVEVLINRSAAETGCNLKVYLNY